MKSKTSTTSSTTCSSTKVSSQSPCGCVNGSSSPCAGTPKMKSSGFAGINGFHIFTLKELEAMLSWYHSHDPYYSDRGLNDPGPLCGHDCHCPAVCEILIDELRKEMDSRRGER